MCIQKVLGRIMPAFSFSVPKRTIDPAASAQNLPREPKIALQGDDSGGEDLPKNLERIHRVITQDRFSGLGLPSGLEINAQGHHVESQLSLLIRAIPVIHLKIVYVELVPLSSHR